MPATAASTARPAHTNHGDSTSPDIAILVIGMVRLKIRTPIAPRTKPKDWGFIRIKHVRYIERNYSFVGQAASAHQGAAWPNGLICNVLVGTGVPTLQHRMRG